MSAEKKRNVVRNRSPHHRVVHSNQIGATITGADIRLRFGCIESATADEMVVEDQVDVYLGPMEAFSLFQLLERQLKRFNIQKVETPVPQTADAATPSSTALSDGKA